MSRTSIVALMSTESRVAPRVGRCESQGIIQIGNLTLYFDMETLRDLCNDIAEVLDGWFDERDRLGTTHE